MTEITQYLKYYIGAECVTNSNSPSNVLHMHDNIPIGSKGIIHSINQDGRANVIFPDIHPDEDADYLPDQIKPILRKLSLMTEEEARGLCSAIEPTNIWWFVSFLDNGILVQDENQLSESFYFDNLNADAFHYLLSKGFWLWDSSAFDKGLIIEATNTPQ